MTGVKGIGSSGCYLTAPCRRALSSEEFAERLREKPHDIILADYALQQWTGMEKVTPRR